MSFVEMNGCRNTNMKFPAKLWLIVNECSSGAIGWGINGDTITLERSKFQNEYLCGDIGIFKTSNIASFVRQLNLYGFRKTNRYNENVHEFQHPLFLKGRKDLVEYIKRKPGSPNCSTIGSSKNVKQKRIPRSQQDCASTKAPENELPVKIAKPVTTRNQPMDLRQPNIMNPVNNFWWNNAPHMTYPNFYYSRDLNPHQSWMPNESPFYSPIKLEPKGEQSGKGYYYPDMDIKENISPPDARGNANMYYLVMPPGYPTTTNHGMYSNPGFYNEMFSFSTLPTDSEAEAQHPDVYSRDIKQEDLGDYNGFF